MEDTLRGSNDVVVTAKVLLVLILILMEDTLRDITISTAIINLRSLNPYSNGRYSQSTTATKIALVRVLS